MLPILLRIGPFSIRTYGLMVALGFLAAMHYARRIAPRYGVSQDSVINLTLYILLSSILGARLLYVIVNFSFYRGRLLDVLRIWSGGMVFYGGFIAAVLAVIIYCRLNRLELFKVADIFAPGVFMGLAIGRIGCLSAGCCYGRETTLPWGIEFSNPICLAPVGKLLHPTQLYESFFAFLVFIFAHYLNRRKVFNGQVFFSAAVIYAVYRFFIEFVRGDDRGAMVYGLQPSQAISMVLFVVSVLILVLLWKKHIRSRKNAEDAG